MENKSPRGLKEMFDKLYDITGRSNETEVLNLSIRTQWSLNVLDDPLKPLLHESLIKFLIWR